MSYSFYGEEAQDEPKHSAQLQQSPTFATLQEAIAEVTGIDPEEIRLQTYLEEFNPADMPNIILKVNQTFRLSLKPKYILEECETVGDLVALIDDEQEWG